MIERDKDTQRIARRHPDIPQDALFPPPPARWPGGSQPQQNNDERRKRQKSVRTATCPKCQLSNGKTKIGVISIYDQQMKRYREVFRDHDKFTRNGTRIHCTGSGMEAPPS